MRLLRNLIFAIPVLGWMIKSAWYGGTSEKAFFVGDLVGIWAFAVYFFGYPALIVPALALAVFCLVGLVFLSAGDLFA